MAMRPGADEGGLGGALAALLPALPEPAVIVDAGGAVLVANGAARELLGPDAALELPAGEGPARALLVRREGAREHALVLSAGPVVDGLRVVLLLDAPPDAEALPDVLYGRLLGSIHAHLYIDELQPDGRVVEVWSGPGIERFLGGTPPPGSGILEAWEAAVHPDDRAVYDAWDEIRRLEPAEFEYRMVGLDGVTRWVLDRCHPRRTADGRLLIDGMISDITERKRIELELQAAREEAERLARTDVLTGLANRRQLGEELERELDRARREGTSLGLLLVDVDHFKLLNDAAGHAAGDDVLVAVAHGLTAGVRAYDLVARVGGDEFAVLAPGVPDLDALHELAAHAVSHGAIAPRPGGRDVTVSVGAALGDAAADAAALLAAADRALYAAKSAGRNRAVVSTEGTAGAPLRPET
jgi:diguanylate cyclase (GGDEF)-like protein